MLSQVRSAFAFQDKAIFYTEHNQDQKISCSIVSFSDSDLRDVTTIRYIEISHEVLTKKFQKGEGIVLEILSDKSRFKIIGKLTEIKNNALVLCLPDSCEMLEMRTASRFQFLEDDWSDALVSSTHKDYPCIFKILDFSKNGIGITLVSNFELPVLDEKLFIESDTISEKFHFTGPYQIERLELIISSQGHYEYSAGLSLKASSATEKEIRAQRHSVQNSIQLFIPATNTHIRALLINVSASGFIAKIAEQAASGIAKDLVALEATAQIKFRITRVDLDLSVGFQLVADTSVDQIKWINLITPFFTGGRTQVSVSDHRSLLNLFFEAGASVVDGLKYKRFRLTQTDTLALFTSQSEVLIRWVNISDNGTILGHHSTYRIGLNSWYTGDVVAGQSSFNKVDKNFFNNNFRILKETIEGFPNEQKIVGSWKPKHPYWQEWRNFLIDNDLCYCLQNCDSVNRDQILNLNLLYKSKDIISVVSIESKELLKVIHGMKADHQWLLSTLDIFSTGNSSEGTNTIYLRSGLKHFKRSIKKIIFGDSVFLAVFSQLPNGISINPNFDSVFLFPITDIELSNDTRNQLYTSAINESARLGYRVSSVRLFSEKTTPLGTLMEFFVIDSRGLGIFR